jgi:hypothetical protein
MSSSRNNPGVFAPKLSEMENDFNALKANPTIGKIASNTADMKDLSEIADRISLLSKKWHDTELGNFIRELYDKSSDKIGSLVSMNRVYLALCFKTNVLSIALGISNMVMIKFHENRVHIELKGTTNITNNSAKNNKTHYKQNKKSSFSKIDAETLYKELLNLSQLTETTETTNNKTETTETTTDNKSKTEAQKPAEAQKQAETTEPEKQKPTETTETEKQKPAETTETEKQKPAEAQKQVKYKAKKNNKNVENWADECGDI